MGSRGASVLLLAAFALSAAPAWGAEPPPPPDTVLLDFPANPSNQPSASFSYAEIPAEAGASFQCRLDSDAFSPCPESGIAYSGPLADGTHTFAVRASGEGGEDPTPKSFTWQIDTAAPETTIASFPPEPSSGFEAAFSFASSEPLSSFRCQLDFGPFQLCANSAQQGSRSYFGLTDGTHTFRVYATDNAGNADPTPAELIFTVQTVLGDRSAPDTAVLSGPQSPSRADTVAFTYRSSEPGSSFECRLVPAPFAPCLAEGQRYGPLKNGAYVFEVRATDRAANTDPLPAPYPFTVTAPLPNTTFAAAPPGTVRTEAKRAKLRFVLKSDAPGSRFYCRLDRRRFKPCKATVLLSAPRGRHRFEAYAVDRLGNVEPSPARRLVRVRGARGGGVF